MGNNSHGQLGDGSTNESHIPKMIVARNVVSVAAGADHSLFIMSDGSLWGMGRNDAGQLGDGSLTDRLLPVAIVFPIILADAAKLPGGAFSFSYNAEPGVSYTVLASTNLSLPLNDWEVVGHSGVRSIPVFIDAGATTNKQRFYSIRSP
jgi:hypothetical protein